MADFCNHVYETSGSVTWNFMIHLNNQQFLKESLAW